MECASGTPRVECERGERVECLSGDGVAFERGGQWSVKRWTGERVECESGECERRE